jgi:hypothetical protein
MGESGCALVTPLSEGWGTMITIKIIQKNILRSPRFVTAADFNHDGNLDLVACTDDEGGATLLLGDGKGGFGTPTLINLNSACQQVLTADLNRDGEADLVFRLEAGKGSVLAALGKGNGTFSIPQLVSSANGAAVGIAVGDLNNDGIPDILITEDTIPGVIETLLGDGHGKFTSKGLFLDPRPSGFHPSLIPALGDFNGDGFLDVAVADELSQVTDILPGNRDGTLGLPQLFAGGGNESSALAAGDLNGDGRTDLVISGIDNRTNKGIVTTLLNNTRK